MDASGKVLNKSKHAILSVLRAYLSSFFVRVVVCCLNALFLPKDHVQEASLTCCEWWTKKRFFVAPELSVSALDILNLSQSSKAQIRRKQSDTKPLQHQQFSFLLQSSWASCCSLVCFFLYEGSFFFCSHFFTLSTKQFPLPVSVYPEAVISYVLMLHYYDR